MNLALFVLLAQSVPFPGPGTPHTTTTPLVLGVDFRATAGFVTDPANTAHSLGEAYPVSCVGNQTVNCGWEAAPDGTRDRDNTVDARLAGINFLNNNQTPSCFRVDLPSSGTYSIRVAMGDASNAQNPSEVQIKDTTTVLATIGSSSTGPAAGHFFDASNTDRTAAAWPGSNTAVNMVFTTTIFRACIGLPGGGGSGNSVLAYVGIGI